MFHYHLVTSRVREVEARYIGKLGFDLVARHGRVGEDMRSYDDPTQMEEERRLCYVGITRARDRLYLSCAFRRQAHC